MSKNRNSYYSEAAALGIKAMVYYLGVIGAVANCSVFWAEQGRNSLKGASVGHTPCFFL